MFYFKDINGNEHGPISVEQIQAWIQENRMNENSLVRTPAENQWIPLAKVPELQHLSLEASGNTPSFGASTPIPQTLTPPIPPPPVKPGRGTLILTLGILSLVCFGPFTGIAAWVMGKADLIEIDAGRMDLEQRASTKAGYIVGVIGTLLGTCGIIFQIIYFN